MNKNKVNAIRGKRGEDEASQLLISKGYKVLQRNWRSGKDELDIIAMNDNKIIFVEVKTRSNIDYGLPYEFVDEKKQEKIFRAAQSYISKYNIELEVRFDIVSIIILKNGKHLVEHIENAFCG